MFIASAHPLFRKILVSKEEQRTIGFPFFLLFLFQSFASVKVRSLVIRLAFPLVVMRAGDVGWMESCVACVVLCCRAGMSARGGRRRARRSSGKGTRRPPPPRRDAGGGAAGGSSASATGGAGGGASASQGRRGGRGRRGGGGGGGSGGGFGGGLGSFGGGDMPFTEADFEQMMMMGMMADMMGMPIGDDDDDDDDGAAMFFGDHGDSDIEGDESEEEEAGWAPIEADVKSESGGGGGGGGRSSGGRGRRGGGGRRVSAGEQCGSCGEPAHDDFDCAFCGGTLPTHVPFDLGSRPTRSLPTPSPPPHKSLPPLTIYPAYLICFTFHKHLGIRASGRWKQAVCVGCHCRRSKRCVASWTVPPPHGP